MVTCPVLFYRILSLCGLLLTGFFLECFYFSINWLILIHLMLFFTYVRPSSCSSKLSMVFEPFGVQRLATTLGMGPLENFSPLI